MTLQRTLSSFGEAEDPTKYSSDLLFSRMGQAKSAFVRAVLCEFVGRIRTTAGQVGSARDVQDEVLVFAALAHSGVDEVLLGVGVVGFGVAVARLRSERLRRELLLILTRAAPAFHRLCYLRQDPKGTWGLGS